METVPINAAPLAKPMGAVWLTVAVTLQAALGIWTLLMVAPLSLALLHQAMAMVVLTIATVHAASVPERAGRDQLADARGFWKIAE